MTDSPDSYLSLVESHLDQQRFQKLHWEGSFQEYLGIVSQKPLTAYPPSRDTRRLREVWAPTQEFNVSE